MIKSDFNWNGNHAKTVIVDSAWNDLRRAVEFFWNHLIQALSVPNAGVRKKRKRGKGTYTVYPNPAPKGKPPRLRTGWLRKHTQREYDKTKLAGRVGLADGARYGLFLEMKDHPWLLATLEKVWDQMKAFFRPIT